ncbi:hypothetical protein [Pseudomonas syringae]|nr:hypothetical protein [Pseudomonas syringae]
MDVGLRRDAELTRMITAGETATQHIALACEFLILQDLELEIYPLTFSFFEDCCDERATIDFSQIPTAHQAALYRALEKADESQGIGFSVPRLRGHQEHKYQAVPINGCPILQLARHLLSKLPPHSFLGGMIDIKFSMDLGLQGSVAQGVVYGFSGKELTERRRHNDLFTWDVAGLSRTRHLPGV